MDEQTWLAERFEAHRLHLRGVAYRILGSLSDADDAVQEAWLRFNRTDTNDVENLAGWLTTVVGRICLDMLRTRTSRREDSWDPQAPEPVANQSEEGDPEQEALLAESVGMAMLVVLQRLAPAERIAFVLHDIFAVPFDDIAPIVERSQEATRQLASRARRRVRGTPTVPAAELTTQREVVDAFLAASRGGNFDALLTLLDPEAVFRADRTLVPAGAPNEVRGASRIARQFQGRAELARPALVNGTVGVVVAPYGNLRLVLTLTIANGKIVEIEAVGESTRLRDLDLAVLTDDEA